MGNPVINRTVAVPAGLTGVRIDVPGKHVKLVSCTVASVLMGFDGSTPERVYADDCYAGPANGFHSLRFVDDLGAGSTVVIQIAEHPILGGTLGTLSPVVTALTTIAGYLLNLWNRLSATAAATVKADTNVAASGGAGTLLFAATAGRKLVEVQALQTNAGYVYIGNDVTVSATNKRAVLGPGDSWYDDVYTGTVYAVGSDANQWICGNQE